MAGVRPTPLSRACTRLIQKKQMHNNIIFCSVSMISCSTWETTGERANAREVCWTFHAPHTHTHCAHALRTTRTHHTQSNTIKRAHANNQAKYKHATHATPTQTQHTTRHATWNTQHAHVRNSMCYKKFTKRKSNFNLQKHIKTTNAMSQTQEDTPSEALGGQELNTPQEPSYTGLKRNITIIIANKTKKKSGISSRVSYSIVMEFGNTIPTRR